MRRLNLGRSELDSTIEEVDRRSIVHSSFRPRPGRGNLTPRTFWANEVINVQGSLHKVKEDFPVFEPLKTLVIKKQWHFLQVGTPLTIVHETIGGTYFVCPSGSDVLVCHVMIGCPALDANTRSFPIDKSFCIYGNGNQYFRAVMNGDRLSWTKRAYLPEVRNERTGKVIDLYLSITERKRERVDSVVGSDPSPKRRRIETEHFALSSGNYPPLRNRTNSSMNTVMMENDVGESFFDQQFWMVERVQEDSGRDSLANSPANIEDVVLKQSPTSHKRKKNCSPKKARALNKVREQLPFQDHIKDNKDPLPECLCDEINPLLNGFSVTTVRPTNVGPATEGSINIGNNTYGRNKTKGRVTVNGTGTIYLATFTNSNGNRSKCRRGWVVENGLRNKFFTTTCEKDLYLIQGNSVVKFELHEISFIKLFLKDEETQSVDIVIYVPRNNPINYEVYNGTQFAYTCKNNETKYYN